MIVETYNADIVSIEQNRVEFGRLLAFWGNFAARVRIENDGHANQAKENEI